MKLIKDIGNTTGRTNINELVETFRLSGANVVIDTECNFLMDEFSEKTRLFITWTLYFIYNDITTKSDISAKQPYYVEDIETGPVLDELITTVKYAFSLLEKEYKAFNEEYHIPQPIELVSSEEAEKTAGRLSEFLVGLR